MKKFLLPSFIVVILFNIAYFGNKSYYYYSLKKQRESRPIIKKEYDKAIDENRWYFYRTNRNRAFDSIPLAPGKIIFFGNSLTQIFDLSVFSDTNIINRGIGGDQTTDLLNRSQQVIKPKPSKIFVEVGINDLGKGKTPEETLKSYKVLLSEIKKSTAKIYVLSVFPVSDSLLNSQVDEFNSMLVTIAKEQGCQFINLAPFFKASDGRIKKEYTVDGVHLTPIAYKVWEKEIRKYL